MSVTPTKLSTIEISRLPTNDKTNAWANILPRREPSPDLKQDTNADWLVIGAGYAGLAAARRLAKNQPDTKIVLVEAGVVGQNASGRNSGFAIDLPHAVSSDPGELAAAHAYMRLSRAAIAELQQLVETYDIKCDWTVSGKYQAAVSERGSQAFLQPFAETLESLEESFSWVDTDELHAKIGSPHFTRAVYTPGCVLMNPAALVRGLADNLPANVDLFENSPVVEVEYKNGVTIKTPNGSVRAPKMILATNGFSEQFGFVENRFIHMAAHATLTRPLNIEERAAYNVPAAWGLTPANAFAGITMRYTNDHRLLIRQDIHVQSNQNVGNRKFENVRKNHIHLFHERFPNLPDVSMEDTWTGYVCMSRNGAPQFGQLSSCVWIAACQNAIGVTKGTISGLLVADLACGRDNPLIADMAGLGEPVSLPHKTLVSLGARAKFSWEVFRNRDER